MLEVMMEKETVKKVIGRFLKKLLIVNLIIFVGSALLNFALGWRTWWDYGNTLMWAGIIVIVFFGLSFYGASSLRGNDVRGLSYSATKNMDRQVQHQLDLEANRIIQAIQYLIIAAIPLAIGTILQSL